jgi:23S rRNA (guanosine2251-2'-O)-methyltransferase
MTNQNFQFGLHAVQVLLQKHPERVLNLLVQQGREDKKILAIIKAANEQQIAIDYAKKDTLDRLTEQANHQGVIAFCKKSAVHDETFLKELIEEATKPIFLLILDQVQDPHNLGACLRSADAAGVDAVIAPKDRSVGITPTVSKVASGAAETVPFVQVTNLARTIEQLKALNVWVYGASANAQKTLYECDLSGRVALVLGGEGAGLRHLTEESCDELLKIPMQGQVESLNVSVAAGIFLFEVVRQRCALR